MQQQGAETTTYSLAASAPVQPDRRSDERYLRLLRVGAIVIEGRRELCLIRNISAGGMMIRAYSPLCVGDALSVELKQGDPVSGTVQWFDNGLSGVAFDKPIDVVSLLSPPGDGPRPRLPRIEIDCTAWVRQGARILRTQVLNISQGGICTRSDSQLAVGADAVVTLPGLTPAPGVVRWAKDGAYGIGFNSPLVLSELVAWLQEQQQDQLRRAAN